MPDEIYAPSESMNAPAGKRKPLRRYGRLRRATMMTTYYVRRSLRFPISAGILLLMLLDGLVCFGTALGLLFAVYNLLSGEFFRNGGSLPIVVAVAAGFAISMYGEVILARILSRIIKEPKGHLLNPVRPEINAIVQDEEVLVRAAMPPRSKYNEILLRAADGTTETNPETLLHAVNGEPSN